MAMDFPPTHGTGKLEGLPDDLFQFAWPFSNALRPLPFLELDNNTAERSMRGIAIGRKNYMFVGSERGGKSAAIIYTLMETAKLNNVDPQAWLTDVLSRIADHKITKLGELVPWNYSPET